MTVWTRRREPGPRGARALRRMGGMAAGMLAATVVLAPPASAHGGPGGVHVPATNYRSRVVRVTPAVPGLEVRTIDAGARLELVNHTGTEVVVLGYQGEPYLRIGRAPEVNVRSPAAYLNRNRTGRATVPAAADPEAPPRWERSGRGLSARWHDHRVHWMGGIDPPQVRAAPGRRHRIESWSVPLLVGGRRVTVSGDLTWIPPPSPWPSLAAALLLAAGVSVASLAWRWKVVLPVAAGALVVAAAADALGAWDSTAEPAGAKIYGLLGPLVGIAFVVGGLAKVRRSPRDGLAMIGGGAGVIALLSGLASLDWLSRSQLPTALDPPTARATVVVAVGVGAGAVAVAAVGLLGAPVRLAGIPRPQPRLRAALGGRGRAGQPPMGGV